jgi:hypothetical protein
MGDFLQRASILVLSILGASKQGTFGCDEYADYHDTYLERDEVKKVGPCNLLDT